ncbi:MAG: 4-hydroxy-tetrahydrodipicolinate reductase [Candidatus Nanopelagicales bacterium]
MIRIALGGATGWTGTPIAMAIRESEDLQLVAAVARSRTGRDLGDVIGGGHWDVPVVGTVEEAMEHCDVYIDYTSHQFVKTHVLLAIAAGKQVVIGSSGLTAADYEDIARAADAAGVGVIAAGNFAITAALAQKAALAIAEHVPHWEVIDYASAGKVDVPSGTARELAEKLSAVQRPHLSVPMDEISGPKEARGADIDGTRVHSVRLPGFVVSTEVVFALPGQRVTVTFEAGESPQPYVEGTLFAARKVMGVHGLIRGLESLL